MQIHSDSSNICSCLKQENKTKTHLDKKGEYGLITWINFSRQTSFPPISWLCSCHYSHRSKCHFTNSRGFPATVLCWLSNELCFCRASTASLLEDDLPVAFVLQDSCRWLRKTLHVLLSCLLWREESFSSSSKLTSGDNSSSSLPVLSSQDGWNPRVEISELARKKHSSLQSLFWFQTDSLLPTQDLPLVYYSSSSFWYFSQLRQQNRLTNSNPLCIVQLCVRSVQPIPW